jgi:transcriptional regulator with PAS, ATPase and Fis domain
MNLRVFVLIAFLAVSSMLTATPEVVQYQLNDTTKTIFSDSLSSMMDFQSEYTSNVEIEHQKLLRNIFAFGFLFMLALMIFTIIFYGRKIKKVSAIIVMQNEVLNSTKDQLIKIINIFNYVDEQVYITDAKGNVEWHNSFSSTWFTENYEKEKINFLNKFTTENQGHIFQGINKLESVSFEDNLYQQQSKWKMVPIKNSKDEFSNMVFVGKNI